MAANLRNIFTRYRKAFCIVLAVLVYLGLLAAVRYYRHYKWVKNNPVSVYDLTWPDKTDGNDIVYRKWRYFIEAETSSPGKIEKYYKSTPDANFVLEETLVISYPTDDEIRVVIKEARLD